MIIFVPKTGCISPREQVQFLTVKHLSVFFGTVAILSKTPFDFRVLMTVSFRITSLEPLQCPTDFPHG